MTDNLEYALRQLLRAVVHEVATELLRDQPLLVRAHNPGSVRSDEVLLLRSKEAATCLGVSVRHLYELTRSGGLPCVRVGKSVRYSVETIREWIRKTEASSLPQSSPAITTTKQSGTANRPKSKPKRSQEVTAQRTTSKKPRTTTEGRTRKKSVAPRGGGTRSREREEHSSPFSDLLKQIGVDRSDIPSVTNGDLMRIAEVDLPTFHGWMYLNRELPEAALGRLREHFAGYKRAHQ